MSTAVIGRDRMGTAEVGPRAPPAGGSAVPQILSRVSEMCGEVF